MAGSVAIKRKLELLGTLSSTWSVFIKSFPLEIREPFRKGGRKSARTREVGRHQETGLSKSTWSKFIWSHKNWKQHADSLHWSAPGLLQIYYSFQFNVFMVFLRVRINGTFWVVFWFWHLLLDCFPSVSLPCLNLIW